MRRYYFDLRGDEGLSVDEEGLLCRDLHSAQAEATRALADMVGDMVRLATPTLPQTLAIEVRDDTGPVMQIRLRFEIVKH